MELEDLSRWDTDDDFALAIAKLVGIERWTIPTRCRVGDLPLTLSLERRPDLKSYFKVHNPVAPRRTLALHEAYAATRTGIFRTYRGPEARRWKLRALVELGFKKPAEVHLPQPQNAPANVRRLWQAIMDLLAIRWLEEPTGSPFVLSAPWFSTWSGLPVTTIRIGKLWLERNEYVERAGFCPGSFGKPAILWRLNETERLQGRRGEPFPRRNGERNGTATS